MLYLIKSFIISYFVIKLEPTILDKIFPGFLSNNWHIYCNIYIIVINKFPFLLNIEEDNIKYKGVGLDG